jgi:hypothetical protein
MDSSTRQAYILGNLRVSRSELTTEDWLMILRQTHEICQSHLKYFGGFKSLKDLGNNTLGDYHWRQTPEKAIYPSELLTSGDRFIELCNINSSTDQAISGRIRLCEDILVLSQKGKWYLWESTYECQQEHGHGYRQHRTATREIATTSVFTELSWPKEVEGFIADMLSKNKASTLQYIVEKFREILAGTIRESQNRLDGLITKHKEIWRILSCFDE